jgi:hypothetical protein
MEDEIDQTIQTGIEDDYNNNVDDKVIETKHCLNYLYRRRIGLLELHESSSYGFTDEADLLTGCSLTMRTTLSRTAEMSTVL